MRKPLIAGNWKMHGSQESANALVQGIVAQLGQQTDKDIVIAPPNVFLSELATQLKNTTIQLAAQNFHQEDKGAFTGEVSAPMLKDFNCTHVIIGHSERRQYFNETDSAVAEKAKAAVAHGLTPIVCVGESLETNEAGQTETFIASQLEQLLALDDETLKMLVIAYEPIWAIGTGRTATPEQAQAVHEFIRAQLAARSSQLAETTRLLYGGSVKAHNAAAIFCMPDIDGGLIGGAALDVDSFCTICEATS
ncbi:MAG: triosephosphate isomerase [marine bacterium B5-7]|nr:MAG: triosephosphate isomerase [marine bacterium B5-7]